MAVPRPICLFVLSVGACAAQRCDKSTAVDGMQEHGRALLQVQHKKVGSHDVFDMLSHRSSMHDLVDRKHKLIMGWSPRAASTGALVMFLENAGFYGPQEQAEWTKGGKEEWKVHDYVISLSPSLYPTAEEMNDPSFIKFKVVQDPLRRAVSQFAHQVETNFSGTSDLQELAASVWGRGYNASSKSFVQWLDLVEKVGIMKFDVHTHPQVGQWESDGGTYDYVCKLESKLEQCLAEINARTHSSLKWASRHVMTTTQPEPTLDIANAPWYQITKEASSHPDWQLFYRDNQVAEKVRRIYHEDFSAYKYSLSSGASPQ